MGKDTTTYNFNGKQNLGKRALAGEIIFKFLSDNSNKNYEELKKNFNFTASNNHQIIFNKLDYTEWKSGKKDSQERYFSPITHGMDNLYIANNWDIDSIQPLIEKAKNEFHYKIEIVNNIKDKEDVTLLRQFKEASGREKVKLLRKLKGYSFSMKEKSEIQKEIKIFLAILNSSKNNSYPILST